MNEKQFNQKLSGVIRSAKNMRESIQELIVSGLVHYENHNDSGRLTAIVTACKGVKSLPTATIADYIKAHANLGWGKLKDGKPGFRTIGKGAEVKMPEVTWYDWEGGKHNQVTSDYAFLSTIKGAITKAVKAAEEGRIKAEEFQACVKVASSAGVELELTDELKDKYQVS